MHAFITQRAPKGLANPTLAARGVVVSALEPTALQAEQRDSIRRLFADLVWDPSVLLRATLLEALTGALPLTGARVAGSRATYELFAQSFLKAVPAP
ncbi:hypothetical protein [Streptomyces sp. NPDC058486]|uniref:hypothetical protein n=1 Tax=unclassified Streptomyces TaxID=2593676 RepID=UPI0036563DF8